MKQKLFFTFSILFLASLGNAQDLVFKEKPLLFKESKTNDIVVVDSEKTIIKLYKNIKIPLKHNGYLGKLNDYISFNIKNKTYLVHSGCGPVLEYRNDSLVRIDKSFLHANQLGAATFTYNNEIYFFGGYGLFTTKNFITKFDFNTKEWRLIKTKNNHLITPLVSSYYFKSKEYFYVFGGHNHTMYDEQAKNKQFLYRLNLKSMIWERLKTDFFTNDEKRSISLKNGTSLFEYKGELILLDGQKLFKINFTKNTFVEYESDFAISSIYIIPNKNKIIALTEDLTINTKSNFSVNTFTINNIFKNPTNAKTFYYEEQPYYLYVLGLVFVLVLGFFVYKKRSIISYYFHPSLPFQYWIFSQALYFKGKKVKHLSENDIKILNKIASHPNQFISLNEFNEMFTIDYETENYAAIVKRREKKLDTFLKLLANVSSFEISDLLQERKNEIDKRIKEVLFLPNKIKYIQK
jgi:hypothetical protein